MGWLEVFCAPLVHPVIISKVMVITIRIDLVFIRA
jgi:hypothetical protein